MLFFIFFCHLNNPRSDLLFPAICVSGAGSLSVDKAPPAMWLARTREDCLAQHLILSGMLCYCRASFHRKSAVFILVCE